GSGYPPTAPADQQVTSASVSASVPYSPRIASGALLPYDPFMDNRLLAPQKPQGVFGLPVKDVERMLRAYGAKPFSYVFGKESRMLLAAYLITIRFDRFRRVGGIIVEPKAPIRTIGTNAQAFFTQTFLSGIDPAMFQTVITPEKISILFEPPPQNAGTEKK
ncbi:MAG TPA: hypothetical protein PLY73_15025, partial [Candidatus Ozemobacteraceae bacterium]|nr:hypothetical protein [Candidatus Ozemobacteraceae bacterium]